MPRLAFSTTAFACLILTAPAFAYSPQWLECTGEVTVTPTAGAPAKEAAKDIYVYDPDARNLFKYSDSQKRLAYLGARAVSDQDIRWSGSSSGIGGSQWEGRLDRTTGMLNLSYKGDTESRVWSESCKPTDPRPES
ncbi:MAG: hypothetical protein K1X51_11310 [Rhodospirillaceae bacterium]|nr:hypothetical protein [Rhodospirillaceae bacterium]